MGVPAYRVTVPVSAARTLFDAAEAAQPSLCGRALRKAFKFSKVASNSRSALHVRASVPSPAECRTGPVTPPSALFWPSGVVQP